MPNASVTVDHAELLAQLAKIRENARDLRPTMAVIAERLVLAVDDNFETAGHGTWPPLALSTLLARQGGLKKTKRGKFRRNAAVSIQILKNTGRLAADQRAESGATFAGVSTSTSYAVYHVSDEERSVIPLRNFYDIPDADLDDAEDILMRGIMGEAL